MLLRASIFLFLIIFSAKAQNLESCKWNNKKGIPCIAVSKTTNSSAYSNQGINKRIINKQDIINYGAIDTVDVLKFVPGLDVFQSGPKGQSTSIFTRGSESNHTLVMINGIAINDQSVTDGLHDFGQDFIQTIQQIEIYKGSNGAHFGPSAIAGAINFITAIDYSNSYSVSGFNAKNNTFDANYTKITKSGWHLNIKGAQTKSKTDSAIADGSEDDGFKNIQVNFNGEKWINDNLKFKSTLYTRSTQADYDGSSTSEENYFSDNRMHVLQAGLDHKSKKSEDAVTFHYHSYDRGYENTDGTLVLDEYDSDSFVIKGERKIIPFNKKISFGYGSEYKYDWGSFENRGNYNASTKGHMKNLGLFGNMGYKINENSILSLYGRSDDHSTTGENLTYKLNFTQFLNKFELGATHSTGLRNPTLYELYGTDNYGIGGNVNIDPEKSRTNELFAKYNFSNKISFSSTAYRTAIFDRIESNAAYSRHENQSIALNQEGLENELFYKGNSQILSFFTNFSKSKKITGGAQSRRPDLNYGSNYVKKISSSPIGTFNLNLNYKHTGKHIDYDGGNIRVKSTDIMNLSLTKKLFGNNFSLNISNLLNERYENPVNYSQDGRQLRIGFRKSF